MTLALDITGTSYGPARPDTFMITGLVLLFLAAVCPAPSSGHHRRCRMPDTPQHPAVQHPVHLRIRRHREGMGAAGKINDWAASHLALVFGSVWTVWTFFVVPLVAPYLGATIQGKIFYYASGWIQLFALALFVWLGNKLQRSSDAQSEVMHQSLTHIATVSDQNKQLIEQNTALTVQGHALIEANTALTEEVRAAIAMAAAPQTTMTQVARTRKRPGT